MLMPITNTSNKSACFTDEQFYVIDTVGLYHYKNFITQNEVDYINKILDKWLKVSPVPPSKFSFFMLDHIFCEIMARRWVIEGCQRTVGPWYRMDHCVGIQQPGKIKSAKTGQWVDQGYELGNIHGGNFQSQGSIFFQSFGKMAWSGQMTFGISLTGQKDDDGGFCFIPGSHKSSIVESGSVTFKNLMGNDFNHQSIYVPDLQAGDAVFFPENLNHGMKPMKKGTYRRAIYYKFVPGFLSWRPYDEVREYSKMAKTPQEARILRPPYVAQIEDETAMMSDNHPREKT